MFPPELPSSLLKEPGNIRTRETNRQIKLISNARACASFDSRRLACIIYGGSVCYFWLPRSLSSLFSYREAQLKLRESVIARIEATIAGDDNLRTLPELYKELDRTAQYRNGLSMGKALLEDEVRHRHGVFNRATHRHALINASPFGLHPAMFVPTLKLQATDEQLAYWLPLADSGRIIGTYCQTEIGHGTFVRGLETTATFDHSTDEFIIDSPTVSSTKYWPGGLGFSCSHAVVMARLLISNRDYGVHPFIMQLRSLDNWKPLPGVEVGDIGLKMGLNSTDNGYAVFHHVRIPRANLLMRNASVARDGSYSKAPHSKMAYSTMIYTRNFIIHTVAFQLAQAATIAIRYSFVREQGAPGSDSDSKPSHEIPIIWYQSQKYRLFTIMSRAFAILFASNACESIYQDLVMRQRDGDNSTLAYGHITTAALKAFASQHAADGSEDARKCCGGHGYSVLSGLPDIVANVTPIATLEGENYVMYQQTARYLVKCASSILRGQAVDSPMLYLQEGYSTLRGTARCQFQDDNFLNPEAQVSIFLHRVVRLVFQCEELLRVSQERDKLSWEEAWNTHMMTLIMAGRAHIELFVLKSFIETVNSVENPSIRAVLQKLCNLFALTTIESPISGGSLSFFEDGFISVTQLHTIRAHVNDLLHSLTPEAIALTDSWNFTDAQLQSALGRKDGDVYNTLLEWTRQIPLNRAAAQTEGVDVGGYERYIRPIVQAKL